MGKIKPTLTKFELVVQVGCDELIDGEEN
jgi:hypothetical protein